MRRQSSTWKQQERRTPKLAQLKAEMADLKAEVEYQSKKRKKGSSKKRYVRYLNVGSYDIGWCELILVLT